MASNEDLLVMELRATAVAGGWSILDPSLPNISNYRHVIVDATGLEDLFPKEITEASRVAAEKLQRMTSKLAEIIRGGARVVVVLPRPPVRELAYPVGDKTLTLTLAAAVGGPLNYHRDPGLRVVSCVGTLKTYLQQLKTVDGVISSANPSFESTSLARSEFDKPLALRVNVDKGAYFYLPPYAGSAGDAIHIVAAALLGTPRRHVAWPEWISEVPFGPVQGTSRDLEQAKAAVAGANERLEQASKEYDRVRRPLVLLV